MFGVNAVWNFFESGHGKGPCDGIGGTSKRTADLAIKQGKITVQDACDYFDKIQQYHTSAEYVFVKSEDCTTKRESLTGINRNLQPVKGTMQIHCVIGMEKGIIATSTTSCYCSDCLEAKYHNTSEACLLKKSIQRNMACDSVENETANETEPEHLDGGNVFTTEDNIVDESGLGNRSSTLTGLSERFLKLTKKMANFSLPFCNHVRKHYQERDHYTNSLTIMMSYG